MSGGSPATKRLKTQNPSTDPESPTQKHPLLHGDDNSVVCGICLSENGTYIQGQIDSCGHYFCFVCIMEWAKIESKCPMCKRRFSTITRPRKDGIFYNERIVNVTQRDQVYDSHGIRSFDPYAETKCSICRGTQDECFLLLCDLCDTAAHSYCVGLGFTVPSCDWYCHDCNILRAEQSNAEETNDSTQHVKLQVADSHVSIMDIVRESSSLDYGPSTNGESSTSATSPAASMKEATGLPQPCPPASGSSSDAADEPCESDGRTLRRCHDVHNRIRALRENWHALRQGSLNFSSSTVDSIQKYAKRHESIHLRQDNSGEPSSISRQLSNEDAKSDFASNKKGSYDTEKAWKMMDIAKKKQVCKISTRIHPVQASSLQCMDSFKMSAQYKHNGLSSIANEKSSWMKQKESMRTTISGPIKVVTTKNSPQLEMPSNIVKASTKKNPGCGIGDRQLQNRHIKSLPSASYMPDSYPSMISMSHSISRSSASPTSTPDSTTSFVRKLDFSEEGSLMKPRDRRLSGRDDNAKSEIQSLVKLNLKLLAQHNQLGVDAFKEIAKVSTHTILAACDLEKPKMSIPSVPGPGCSHAEHIRPLHKSSLMPNSCRECFFAFVKNVVDTVMSEKVGSSTSCRQ